MSPSLDVAMVVLSWPIGGLAVLAAFRPHMFRHGAHVAALVGFAAAMLNGWMMLRGVVMSGPQVLLWAHAALFGAGVVAMGRGLSAWLIGAKAA